MKIKKDKEKTKSINEIIKQLNNEDEDEDTKYEEEVMRLDPYTEGGLRPVKQRLKT